MIVHVGPDHFLVRWMRTRPGRFISACAFCVALTLLAAFLVPIGWRQFELSRDPARAVAQVLETKVFGGDPQTKTQLNPTVRYRFVVDGVEHGYVGPTGGVYADVSREVMDAAARTGQIEVIYRPSDPRNNAPAAKQRFLLAWAAGLMAGPTLLALGAWVWVARVARDELRRRIGPDAPLVARPPDSSPLN